MIRFRSIISRVVALQVIAIGVTSILMPLALYRLLGKAANNLHRETLRNQAVTVGSFLRPEAGGGVILDIPDDARPLYADRHGLYAYAVLDALGQVLFSSRADGAALFPSGGRRRATGSHAGRPRDRTCSA